MNLFRYVQEISPVYVPLSRPFSVDLGLSHIIVWQILVETGEAFHTDKNAANRACHIRSEILLVIATTDPSVLLFHGNVQNWLRHNSLRDVVITFQYLKHEN